MGKALKWAYLAFGVLLSSFGIALVAKGEYGISAISSVAYSLSIVFPVISFGAWNYVFQLTLLISMCLVLRRFSLFYFLGLVTSVFFSLGLDGFSCLFSDIGENACMRLFCFVLGTAAMMLGVALLMKCALPIMPQELFVREISREKGVRLKVLKTSFDVSCVVFSSAIGLIKTGSIYPIGVGTLISALVMGTGVSFFKGLLDKLDGACC